MKLFLILLVIVFFSCSQDDLKTKTVDKKINIDSLIMLFAAIDQGDVGYHPSYSSKEKFYPIDSGKYIQPMVWGEKGDVYDAPKSFVPLIKTIGQGYKALPYLLSHLSDTNRTKYTINHKFGIGGIVFYNQYDYNKITLTDTGIVTNVNSGLWNSITNRFLDEDFISNKRSYTLTIGDICFVAIGQILNRNFSVIRYQPTGIIVINSPVVNNEIKTAVMKEWGNLNKEGHKNSLINDFLQPDYEWRQTEAYKRLRLFYPDEINVLKQKGFSKKVDSLEKSLMTIKDLER